MIGTCVNETDLLGSPLIMIILIARMSLEVGSSEIWSQSVHENLFKLGREVDGSLC